MYEKYATLNQMRRHITYKVNTNGSEKKNVANTPKQINYNEH